jgi:glycosyltransferase involved in cell wall biosynthesis
VDHRVCLDMNRPHPRLGASDSGWQIRVAHFTTVDISLWFLLRTELVAGIEAGHEVVGISATGSFVPKIESLGVRHVAVPGLTRSWSPRSDLAAAANLWRLLRSLQLDVLHTHTPKAGVIGRIVGRLCGVPVVVNTCHGLVVTDKDRWAKRVAVKAIEALAAQFSDAELFQNPDDQKALARFLRAGRSEVVGNGIDLQAFAFDSKARARVRAELGVSPGELLVGGVGRRVTEKGIREFAGAAKALSGKATFVWVGPLDTTKANSLDRDLDGVTFIGERLDMPAVYSALDVFVLPSYREGFPRSAMEAAACGRPMVLTDIRGSREIGRDGHEALFIPPRDTVCLAVAIERLLSDPMLRDRLGALAQERARRAFDQRAVVRRSYDAYRAVARRKGLAWARGLALPGP